MITRLDRSSGKTLGFKISEKLRGADYQHFRPTHRLNGKGAWEYPPARAFRRLSRLGSPRDPGQKTWGERLNFMPLFPTAHLPLPDQAALAK